MASGMVPKAAGWLSRWLTQLGCQVTLLDVSPPALAVTIAREISSCRAKMSFKSRS
jgi:2-polyprenyl-3-methyl-5-hydroxy-6-metoxy-1,4-benzoquinol methylase